MAVPPVPLHNDPEHNLTGLANFVNLTVVLTGRMSQPNGPDDGPIHQHVWGVGTEGCASRAVTLRRAECDNPQTATITTLG